MKFIAHGLTITLLSLATSVVAANCSQKKMLNESRARSCCRQLNGDKDITEKCATETGFEMPSEYEGSVFNLPFETILTETCLVQCVFKEWNIMTDGELNMDAVKSNLETNYPEDPAYVKAMLYAFDQCHSEPEKETAKFLWSTLARWSSENSCEALPSVILTCVIREFFYNCPAGHWAKTKECKTGRAISLQCKDQPV